jgi:hypothetical protein
MTGKLIKVCLALYFANAKKMGNPKKLNKNKHSNIDPSVKLKMMEL